MNFPVATTGAVAAAASFVVATAVTPLVAYFTISDSVAAAVVIYLDFAVAIAVSMSVVVAAYAPHSLILQAQTQSGMNPQSTPIDDNPCWGGPEPHQHNLEYLLQFLGKKEVDAGSGKASSIPQLDHQKNFSSTSYLAFIQRIHQKLILYQDESYIVIHKPPDLRMDGPYRATVHKLLLYLFPTPSLQKMVLDGDSSTIASSCGEINDYHKNEMRSNMFNSEFNKTQIRNGHIHGNGEIDHDKMVEASKDDFSSLKNATTDGRNSINSQETSINHHHHHLLLQFIAPLSKHNSLDDDHFRPVHQLDYATSGVLLIAKNKHAASTACRSFQERRTQKQYVAMITVETTPTTGFTQENRTSTAQPLGPKFFQNIPILPSTSLSQWENGSLEQRYRTKRRRETEAREGKQRTFSGYMPVHSVFAKWRAELLREKKTMDQPKEVFSEDNVDGMTSTLDAVDEEFTAMQQDTAGDERRAPGASVLPKRKKYTNLKQCNNRNTLPPLPKLQMKLTAAEIDELLSLGPSWKVVKSHGAGSNNGRSLCWETILETMTQEYNQSLAEYYARDKEKEKSEKTICEEEQQGGEDESDGGINNAAALPPLFRIQGDGDGNGDVKREDGTESRKGEVNNESPNSFYICASIGEPNDGQFGVIVDPFALSPSRKIPDTVKVAAAIDGTSCISVVPKNPDSSNSSKSLSLPEMKPSLTKCTVLWRGYVQAGDEVDNPTTRIPVAKVLLEPRTGRRHQLRVHMAHVVGCPILGDVTYGGNVKEMETTDESITRKGKVVVNELVDVHEDEFLNRFMDERGILCHRMCLHAKKLIIPLIGGNTKEFSAPDPFYIIKQHGCKGESLDIL